jgi:uncharacterized Tic20 family protein
MSEEAFQQGVPQPGPAPTPEASAEVKSDDKTMGMLCHLLALSGYFVPFGNFIGPLVIWLIKKDSSRFVDYHGKESLNFQINLLVYVLVSIPLFFCVVGIFTLIGALIYGLIIVIVASVSAYNGQWYRYPYIFRLIK